MEASHGDAPRRRGRAWPLRHRLLAALLGLSAAALAVFAAAGVLLLDRSLLARVDAQLTAFATSFGNGPPPGAPPPPPRRGGEVELPTQFRVTVFAGSGVVVRRLPGTGDGPDVPPELLEHPPAAPFTVPDRSGDGEWRTMIVRMHDGNRAAVSLSLESHRSTVRQLLLIEAAAGVLVLVLLGAVALVVVRIGLRPLTRMERTAAAIAAGELDRRVSDSDPRTETGRLGHALNVMLGRLSEALRQRERSEQRLRRFLADASHELRTPLTSIRGFAELYRHGRPDPDPAVARILSRIEGEAERMGVLVEDLLLLARLDEERALDMTEVDLPVIAGDVVHGARARDPGREVELVLGDGPVRVLGDEHRLHRVLANLVGNAITHTPPGTPVHVVLGQAGACDDAAAVVHAGADHVREPVAVIEVRDEGPGIDPEHLPRIFDRFYRAGPSRKRRGGGTGLGLAIAAALVGAHGGRIEARSRPGRGTAFRVLLPAVPQR
ncbi:sensor histidine kinase [Nonomuraea fastidiosa]|jgi:two-component system OmpR family sensor kinase|uniref:sensor histidine kinase n=1 Tax=Nonomuraea TaxID=83681 RepID=UPI003245D309